ncbi:Glucosamine--fructose-6-phosphate aminotransferase [isomerizing] [Desulfurella amilsii]|uniref:Glutamine--fructose-6-phosphate aminotransferase [isomerizing] n=1 Tax=Desulfurella amilsii TaxID=1562698 RepID=A0A1X4XZZ9_9BACT|nr:glutamine--fructose-6-phosphate transaminase (isomerizing) [Desulfurella amilsii]OSS43115.1 Glucosamine--fructose-6-phosphate aminotransferase [isomerizing] [Desulfurella amilsii]
MCGIVGYIGNKKASGILLNGLSALEYRGYDSAGIALLNDRIEVIKVKGKVADLVSACLSSGSELNSTIGIGHTRWATHGKPSKENAHPHSTKNFAIVHNGIIENFKEIDDFLLQEGYKKSSATDTETILLLIDYYSKTLSTFEALKKAMSILKGSFAIALIHLGEQKIYAAKKESPLLIGLQEDELFLASDLSAFLEHTKQFVVLEENDIAILEKNGRYKIYNNANKVERLVKSVDWNLQTAQKGGFKHFMLKEISEEDEALANTIYAHIQSDKIELDIDEDLLRNIKKITIVACGTSYYAGLTSKYFFEDLLSIPVSVEIASEFRYSKPIFSDNNIFIAISQSGETADTKESLNLAKALGIKTISIVNVQESTIARLSDYVLYTLAGPEISVASTKAFVCQLAMLYLLALKIAQLKGIDVEDYIKELNSIPPILKSEFNHINSEVEKIAKKYSHVKNFIYLGRGLSYPLGLEGALKLKEISYIHAEGYPAGELKHGPIALIDKSTPTFVIAPGIEPFYSKTISNANEVKARDGKIILLSEKYSYIADDFIESPKVSYFFSAFINIVPLQLFAYHIANILGNDVDQPRNLAKSVTVE